jgi:hypothetical protein
LSFKRISLYFRSTLIHGLMIYRVINNHSTMTSKILQCLLFIVDHGNIDDGLIKVDVYADAE